MVTRRPRTIMSDAVFAPERLYLMQLATGTVIAGDQPVAMSAGCYLIQMRDGRNILVDSGFPPGYPQPLNSPFQRGTTVVEHLAALGLQPDDIDLVVSTHFDIDHCGYHDAFPDAEHVAQRELVEAARGGHPRFAAARPHWDHPALDYRVIDGDAEIAPGVELIDTGGHAPGHQSVLVRLPQTGPVLLAIDAVSLQRQFTPERSASPLDDDEARLRASTRKLLDLVDREGVQLVVFGHDGEQWQSLRKAPDWYA
jgi:N-acyl homoserine lactone hydrolase